MTNGNDSAFASKRVRELKHKDALGNQTVNYITEDDYGLTKREYFAAMAMQGLMANPERYRYVTGKMAATLVHGSAETLPGWSHEDATRHNAEKAVYLADALIEALNAEVK